MSFNLFAAPTQDDIRVGYIDPTLGYVDGVSICEANEYAKNNPGTTFIFRDGDNNLRYLNINEVNRLTPNDLSSTTDECGGIQQYKECGPPRIQFFGGGGIGAFGNPVIGRDGSLLAVDVVTGGYGYQYPPIVAARDDCQFGNGAVLTAVLGETVDEIEVFEGEEDFEEYELCEDTDVGYGRRYGPNGEDLGPWEPQTYTRVGADPIQREIEIFQKALKKPFWTTRQTQPDRVFTVEKSYATQDTTPVTFPEWGEFMNQYAVSPVKPSDTTGSDEAGRIFSMEWELNFPISGEYIFRGLCDNIAQVYIDDSLVGDLKGFKDNPSPLQKTIQEGNHILKVDLLNGSIIEKVSTPDTVDITFTITGEGRRTNAMKFSFVSDSKTFILNGNDKSDSSRQETIKLNPNTIFKVIASSTKSGGVEQGIVENGTKNKEGGIGESNRIFADHIQSDNDNDDIQITTNIGTFKATNKRKTPDGRTTFDLVFDPSASAANASSSIREVISSQSWNENPMGVSMIIDAPLPPIPQEQPPVQTGRCPPNPIWTTRFPGASQQWYPVRFSGSKTIVEETVPSAPIAESETQEVSFSVYGEGGPGISKYSFIFTAVDGQHTFTLNGVNKDKETRVEKIQIRKNVNYVVVANNTGGVKFEQGLIADGKKKREGGIGESKKIFADGVGSENDNDDIQVTTNLGKFISSNKGKVIGTNRTNFDLTYVLEAAPSGSKNVTQTLTRIYDTPGWSKFMNRYAISPILPLDTPGSDVSGTTFSNSWEIDLPYAGFYGVKGTKDNDGRILIDGIEISSLDGFNVDNPKLTKVYLTKGRHTIVTEIFNKPVQTQSVIDTKIFSTQDWRVAGTEPPSSLNAKFIQQGASFYLQVDGSGSGEINFVMNVDDKSYVSGLSAKEVKIPSDSGKVNFVRTSSPLGGVVTKETIKKSGTFTGGRKYGPIEIIGAGVDAKGPVPIKSESQSFFIRDANDDNDIKITIVDVKGSSSPTATKISQSPTKNGVTYDGPTLFGHIDGRWSKYMNDYSVSPQVSQNIGKFTLTWKNVNFPETGTYKFNFQADNNATLKVGDREIFKTSDFSGEKVQYIFNATSGKYDVVVELENIKTERGGDSEFIFSNNPMGVALYISKDIMLTESNKTPWISNPVGISAILIPPPCAKKIGGRGVVDRVIVEDPGNGFPPPQGEGYPVALILEQIIVKTSGINYRCGEDELQITPNNGAELSYECDSFGRITTVKVEIPGEPFNIYPEITLPSETGVNATFRPVFRVLRDPLLPPEQVDKIIQVTDLVGLKQTGYVDGRAYYGAVYYDEGIPFAGYYKTAGPQTRVYATLQESITARVTTPASAIQRSGTDVRSNDPRLNIPGTIQDTQT